MLTHDELMEMGKLDSAVIGLVSGHLRAEAKLHSDMAIHDRLIAWAEGIEGVLARAEKAEALVDEGLEILTSLIDNISRRGHYSVESTVTFIDQAGAAFREARAALKEQGQ